MSQRGDHARALATRIEDFSIIAAATVGITAATGTKNAAPVIGVIGGVLVALIAARTASRRLTQQLAAESSRHRESIVADASRHRAQLEHERKLADLADLRLLLDDASGELRRADRVVDAYLRFAVSDVSARAGSIELADRERALDEFAGRLRIRVPAVDAVTIGFAEAHSTLREFIRLISQNDPPPAAELERMALALKIGIENFYSASFERAGAVGRQPSVGAARTDGEAAAKHRGAPARLISMLFNGEETPPETIWRQALHPVD